MPLLSTKPPDTVGGISSGWGSLRHSRLMLRVPLGASYTLPEYESIPSSPITSPVDQSQDRSLSQASPFGILYPFMPSLSIPKVDPTNYMFSPYGYELDYQPQPRSFQPNAERDGVIIPAAKKQTKKPIKNWKPGAEEPFVHPLDERELGLRAKLKAYKDLYAIPFGAYDPGGPGFPGTDYATLVGSITASGVYEIPVLNASEVVALTFHTYGNILAGSLTADVVLIDPDDGLPPCPRVPLARPTVTLEPGVNTGSDVLDAGVDVPEGFCVGCDISYPGGNSYSMTPIVGGLIYLRLK